MANIISNVKKMDLNKELKMKLIKYFESYYHRQEVIINFKKKSSIS